MAINRAHQVVGSCRFVVQGGVGFRAVFWPSATEALILDELIPAGMSLRLATGINDAGLIVGIATDGRGFLLTPVSEPPSLALRLNRTQFSGAGQTRLSAH